MYLWGLIQIRPGLDITEVPLFGHYPTRSTPTLLLLVDCIPGCPAHKPCGVSRYLFEGSSQR